MQPLTPSSSSPLPLSENQIPSSVALLQHAPVLVWHAGFDGKCTWVNSTWLAFTGRTFEQELGYGWVEGVHTGCREACVTSYREAVRSRQPFELEYRWRHHTGEYRWIRNVGTPSGGDDVLSSGYIGFCLDITERKEAEQKQADLQRLHEHVLHSMVDGVFGMDVRSLTTFVNPAVSVILGWSNEELLGKDLHALIHRSSSAPSSCPHGVCPIWETLRDGQPRSVDDGVAWRKDGTLVRVAYTCMAMKDEDGRVRSVVVTMRDGTERRRVEEALRLSQERWQFALEGSGDGVWDWNVQSGEMFISPRWKEMLGYAQDAVDVSWDQWLTHVHPNDVSLVAEEIRRHLEGNSSAYQCEVRMKMRDGSYRWIVSRGKIMSKTPDGAPLRMVGTYTDITVLKRLLQSLGESQLQFSQAFHHAPIGMALVDIDGRWMQVNAVLCQILQYSEEELLGMRFQDITHPDDLFLDAVRMVQLLKKECTAYEIEKRYIRKDGAVVWAQLSVSYVGNMGGCSAYFIAQIQDVTARRIAEERLHRSEAQFVAFMDNLKGAAWIKDQTGVYLYANKKWKETVKSRMEPEGSVVGETDSTLVMPSELKQARVRSDRKVVRTQHAIQSVEYFSQGRAREILLTSRFPIRRDDGQPVCVGGLAIDITKRVRAEEALRKSRVRLRLLLDERERMSRDLHDHSIQMLYAVGIDLCECQALAGTSAGRKNVRAILTQSVHRVNEVIRELRQYLTQPAIVQTKMPEEVLVEILSMIRFPNRSSKTTFMHQVDLEAIRVLDYHQVRHVMAILREGISNILRHAQASEANITLKLMPTSIYVEIADNGIGIADDARRGRSKHGLCNIQKRAANLKGEYTISSTGLGGGTILRLSIPRGRDLR